MSNTAIVPVSSITTNLSTEIAGFEGYQIKPSQIRLIQQGSLGAGDTFKVGKLVDGLSGTHFDKLIVVPLDVRKGRVFFPPDKNVGGTPLCRSNNGIVPVNNVPEKQASRCDICPHGPKLWRTFKQTGIQPDCDETINLLFIERESGFPYYLTVKGSSIKLFNQINQSIFRDILMNQMKGNELKLYDYSFEIVPTRIQGGKGNYYALNFTNLVKVANKGEYGPLFEMFVKSQDAVTNEETTETLLDAEVEVEPEYVEA